MSSSMNNIRRRQKSRKLKIDASAAQKTFFKLHRPLRHVVKANIAANIGAMLSEAAHVKGLVSSQLAPAIEEEMIITDDHQRSRKSKMIRKTTRQSALLDLAPEIRNEICALALIDVKPITVDAKLGFEEPGLLLACKTLRTEAAPVFYDTNTFFLDQEDHDSDMLVRWKKKTAAVKKEWQVTLKTLPVNAQQSPNWSNVKLWLQRVAKGEVDVRYPTGQKGLSQGDMGLKVQRLTLELAFAEAWLLWARAEKWSEELAERRHGLLRSMNVLWS